MTPVGYVRGLGLSQGRFRGKGRWIYEFALLFQPIKPKAGIMSSLSYSLACPIFSALTATLCLADPSSVRIEVTGAIQPRCSNTGFPLPLQAGNIVSGGSRTIQFKVDCNAPFQYSLESQYGGFRLQGSPPAKSNLASDFPYTVLVHIPLNSGAPIDNTCASRAIKAGSLACRFTDSGDAVAIQKQGEMKIMWDGNSKQLVAGTYQDRLTVSLSLRP